MTATRSSRSTDTFFHLEGITLADQACQGTACFVARHRDQPAWERAIASEPRVHCLGLCHLAPATADRVATAAARPAAVVDASEAVVLRGVASGRTGDLAAYRADAGYAGLERALAMGPDAVVAEIELAGLRGRGGAAFPAARKWQTARHHPAPDRWVVANADEGDPGAYGDRVLAEDDPHALIEGLAITAVAVGAQHAAVYVRKEYPVAHRRLVDAVAEAEAAGVLGPALAGGGPPLHVAVVGGEGSYLCGEETALLNALEGRRPMVRARPPYPAVQGLFGLPTVVHNVETLAALPWILRHGSGAYAALGTPGSTGTKLLSLNSLFGRPGLYEVELGLPVREVVERLGGGLSGGELSGVLVGGPLAGVLPPSLLDTRLGFEQMRAVGCDVGHGGVVAFDGHTSILELAHHVFRFGAYESCGACTPCRAGTARIEAAMEGALAGAPPPGAAGEWRAIVEALAATSLCGHGTGLAAFARSLMTHFGPELDRCLA